MFNCTYYLLTCRISIFSDFVFIKDQFFPFLLNDLGNRKTKIEVNVQWREYYLIITLSVKWWRVESKRVCSRPIAVKGNRILFASQGLVVLSEMICVILWLDYNNNKNTCSANISNHRLISIKFRKYFSKFTYEHYLHIQHLLLGLSGHSIAFPLPFLSITIIFTLGTGSIQLR